MRTHPARLIAAAKLRILARTIRSHLFTVVGLGPMIVFGFWFILEPTLLRAAGWLHRAAEGWSQADLSVATVVLTACWLAAGLPSAIREIYSLGSADACLDALPVGWKTRFHLSAVLQLLRNAPALVVLWAALEALSAAGGTRAGLGLATASALLVELTLLQLLIALLTVRWGWFQRKAWAGLGWVGITVGLMTFGNPLWKIFAAPLLPAAGMLRDLLGATLDIPVDSFAPGVQVLAAFGFYATAVITYSRWRDDDRERARASLSRKRRRAFAAGLSRRFLPPLITAQLARDLRLTLRGFSQVVYVAPAAAALFQAAAWSAVAYGWVPAQWTPMFVMLCCALSTLSLAALAPLLLRHEIPRMWLERSAGTDPETILKAKAFYALAVAAPAWASTAGVVMMMGPSPDVGFWLVLRTGLAWLTVATVVGALAFEIAESPVLGLMLGGLLSVAICGIYAIDDVWPLGLFFYAYLMQFITGRAVVRASRLGEEA